MKTLEAILKATKYSDLFSSDEHEAKKQFREYCKIYHPDVDNSVEASKAFAIISELYSGTSKTTTHGAVQETFIFKDKKSGKGFEINNPVMFNNGIAMVYHTATKIVMEFDKTYKKFYDNFLRQVKNLKYEDKNMENEFSRYFPKVVNSFESENGNFVILMNKTSEVLNLGLIVKSYEKKGILFPERQAAWIMNRLYNLICYIDFYKKAFNGISLENIWVSPEMHTVLFLDGFEYTTKAGEDMLGCPKDVYKVLPIKVKDTKQSDILTDLESIKQIGTILFKGHKDLEHINKFLSSGVKSSNPLDEWRDYGDAIKKQFGKRTFVVWENVLYNI